ncbi:hypothetical protein CASFOL_005522 [Castilleja foliolosa]|uniref:Uncharacterized protein n=1 Tax=Castilleja foliolosa TaxID=1961234 RepID=A0ABD3E7P3_9LAMI
MALSIQVPPPLHCLLSHKLPNNCFSSGNQILKQLHIGTKQLYPQRRRSANYSLPSYGKYSEFHESNGNKNTHHSEEGTIKKMEVEIRWRLENDINVVEPLALLELIDVDIHRLGIGYRFQESTNKALDRVALLLQYSSTKLILNDQHKILHNSIE